MYESFWPEKVDHGVLVAPLCYFSLLLVVSAEQCSPTYRLPLKEKQRGKHFQWPLVAFKKVKWRTTMKWIAHGWTPLHFFPALGLFSRAVRSWQGGLLQLFPLFQPVTFFSAWHYALFTDLKDYKPISDQSNVFQVTENGLQIFFYLSVLNTRNKNLHSNAKSVLAEDLSSCFFNDPSLNFWWAIRSLLQSVKIRVSQWKKVRGILGG